MIDRFAKIHRNNCYVFSSMGYKNYLSTIKFVDICLGNSSSGLLEVPTFKKFSINIGDRQKDRLRAKSVIDVEPKSDLILKTIKSLYNKKIPKNLINPYGDGDASKLTYKIIKKMNFKVSITNKFFDI